MSILHQLKMTAASPKKDASPIGRFRRRMVEAIDLQIDIANADATGQAFTRTRQKWVKSAATGEKELRHVAVPLRRWWWKNEKGLMHLSIRSGGKLIELAPGKNAIEIGAVTDLLGKLSLVRDAIIAGELDNHATPATANRVIPKTGKPLAANAKAGTPKP